MEIILIPIVAFGILIVPLAISTLFLEWMEETKSPFNKKK